MRTRYLSGFSLLVCLVAGSTAQAQRVSASDEPSYRKEFTYGINFNTRGGLIGGVSVRSLHLLSQDWARFWSIEAVEVKHPKEQRVASRYGGLFVEGKRNYMFVLRPSFGAQRVIFRKAPESGVQVNASFGAGPSVALLMPYFLSYDYTDRSGAGGQNQTVTDIRNQQYSSSISEPIVDRAPLFSGAGDTKPQIGAHLRGALSFEYGRYRDAVAGVETGFLLEAYTKRVPIMEVMQVDSNKLNDQFFPSVYLTIYLGSRN